MKAKTFREACCERFGWSFETFEEEVLRRCLHRRAKLTAKFIRRLNPRHFEDDLALIRAVAECTTLEDLRADLYDYSYHHPSRGFLRSKLRVRLSGQRLVNLASKVFR